MMIFVHVIEHVYNESWAFDFEVLLSKPFYIIGSVGILAFLSTFAGLFLLISMIVNTFSLYKKAREGKPINQILRYQILTGIALSIIAVLVETFIGYYGSFGYLLRLGINNTTWDKGLHNIFEMETLNAIGYAIIILAIVQFFMLQNDGIKKVRRNIVILGILGIAVIVLTPVLWDIAGFIYEGWPSNQYQLRPFNLYDYIVRYCLSVLTGKVEPLFPFMATAFFGAMIGTALGQENLDKRLFSLGSIGGGLITIVGVIFIIFSIDSSAPLTPIFGEFDFTVLRPGVPLYLVETGIQILVTIFLLWIFEFRGSESRLSNYKKYTTPFRRYGILALSVYAFQAFEMGPRYWLQMAFGFPSVFSNSSSWWQTLILAGVVLLFWEGILRLWERFNFILSLEWLIVLTVSFGRITEPSRLKAKSVLYEVEPISLKPITNSNPLI